MKSVHYGILGFTTVLASMSPEMAMALEKIGVVGLAGTTVTATGEDGAARVLKTGDDVYLNDHIVSDAAGKAQLIFLDRSTLTLNQNTDLTLDKYVYDPSTAGGTMAVSSVKGAFRFVGGALSKKQPVTIKTPVATIGIRGGIADTNVTPGTGASDAVFVYGDELTMTNQNGDTFSTTQIGTGLMLDTPTGTPLPMPAEMINQRMQSFGTPSPDSGDGANNGSGDSSGTGGTAANSAGSGGGTGGASSGSGPAGGATVQLVNSGGDPVGAPITFANAVDGVVGDVAQASGTEEIKVAIIQGDESVLPGISNVPVPPAASNLPPPPPPPAGDTATILPPPPPPPAPAGDSVAGGDTSGSSSSSSSSGSSGGSSSSSSSSSSGGAVVPHLRGRYYHYDGSVNMISRGDLDTPTDTNVTDFAETERRGTPVFIYDANAATKTSLAHTSASGSGYSTPGSFTLSLDQNNDNDYLDANETVSGSYYGTPGDSFRQYYTASGGEPLTFYQGIPIFDATTATDASRISEARTRSTGVSAAEGFEGISFYSYLPDIAGNHSPNPDLGPLDFRMAGSSVSNQASVHQNLGYGTVAGEHLRTGPGLMVDWQKGRFLTQNVEFVANTTGKSPSAALAAGVVNNGAPNFLDGKLQRFEGEKHNTTVNAGSTDIAFGSLRVGHEIYGNATGRIEALVAKVDANSKVMQIPAGYLYTSTGSTSVQITVPGGDFVVGDHVVLSGISGPIGGVPAASFNREFIVSGVSSNIITIQIDTAATTSEGGTAFSLTPHEVGAQAAVIDSSHGLNTADFNSSTPVGSGGQRSGSEMRGFAAGLVKNDMSGVTFSTQASGTTTSSGKLTGVVVTPSLASGSVGSAQINTTHHYGAGPGNITASFGGTDSAYMNDKHYGAAQTSSNLSSGGGNGFITTATHDKTITPTCTTCQYTHWGVWAADMTDGANKYNVEMMPYVAGRVSDATEFDSYRASAGNTGSATYNGDTYGSFVKYDGTNRFVQNAQGTMTANVDLANREIDDVTLNYSAIHGGNLTISTSMPVDATPTSGAHGLVPIAATGDAVFNASPANVAVTWAGHSGTGNAQINGALFGPLAQEIGGNFTVEYNSTTPTATLQGGGIYHGVR